MTNQATRIIVKAVGELSTEASQVISDGDEQSDIQQPDVEELAKEALQVEDEDQPSQAIDVEKYIPSINSSREWVLSELDLGRSSTCRDTSQLLSCAEWIADGCGVLGTGGGGSPYPPFLVARQHMREGKSIKVGL